jgi:hypothetical protein
MSNAQKDHTATWVLGDGLGHDLTVVTEEDLTRGLDEIDRAARDRGEPLTAMLYPDTDAADPPHLSIGLGSDESVLVYSAGNWSGEGAFSKGPRDGDTSEHFFRFGTATNQYLGWMLIPKSAAYAVAVEFFHTGQQPSCVEWGDV